MNVLDLRSGELLPRSCLRLDLPGQAPSVGVTGVPGSLFAAYTDVIDEHRIYTTRRGVQSGMLVDDILITAPR